MAQTLQNPRLHRLSVSATVMSIACALISCSFLSMVVTIKVGWMTAVSHDSFWSVMSGLRIELATDVEIHIDSSNDVPIRRQLIEQIIFLIATERLKDGELLPSVRELARRLKVHHNTVSEAYQDLVQRKWLERRRGSRLAVLSREAAVGWHDARRSHQQTITGLARMAIPCSSCGNASASGSFRKRPDHILVVEQDEGLRDLIREELKRGCEMCRRRMLA